MKNPLVANLINLIPAAVNTVGNIFKDKKKAKEETSTLMAAILPDEAGVSKGIELSSKSVVGYGIAATIITWALTMPFASEAHNLYALGLGVALIIGTTIAKVFEK